MSETKKYTAFPVMYEQVDELFDGDDRFTKVRVWLMHLGKNYNGSIFEKPVVESAIPTLGYIPIVGFIELNSLGEEDFSDHRYIIKRKNGEKEYTYVGMPYGFILANDSNNAHFENRLCDDGITREFLVVDGALWNQFKGAEILNRDEVKDHSMELFEPSVEGYEDDDNWFHFTKFSFQAACILGKDYKPAMEGSTIELRFSMSDFISEMQAEMFNKVQIYTHALTENAKEGGKPMEENKDFALNVMESIDEVCAILGEEQFIDRWGWQSARYGLIDIQGNEVIVYDRKDNWRKFGMVYTVDGDKISIDFASAKRKKTVYEDFDSESAPTMAETAFEKAVSDVADYVQSKISEVESAKVTTETEYANVKSELEEIKPKYEEFVRQESERIESEAKAAKDELFEKFDSHLSADNRYIELKSKMNDYSLDELRVQCSLYFAENNLKTQFTKNGSSQMILDIPNQEEDKGLVVTKYGVIKKTKK